MSAPDETKLETAPGSAPGPLVVGGGLGVFSAEAIIQYASHFSHPYNQYLIWAAPAIAVFLTALWPRLIAASSFISKSAAEYLTQKREVRTANRAIAEAKKLLKKKDMTDEERKYCDDAIKSHRMVILHAHVPMPKTRTKAQQV